MMIHKSHTEVSKGNNQAPTDMISELPINLRICRKVFGRRSQGQDQNRCIR
jgi:hypothetical protein